LSILSSVFKKKSPTFEDYKSSDIFFDCAVRCDTSRLPQYFREKFEIGNYKIDESDGDIRIDCCRMGIRDQQKFIESVQDEKILAFWRNFTLNYKNETIIYLEIGGGTYFFPELFEKLVIIRNGKIERNLEHNCKWKFIRNDQNIQAELRESVSLSEDFRRGKAKIFIYHKPCQSLTSLYFDQHDEAVAAIDFKRAIFRKYKSVLFFVAEVAALLGIGRILSNIPLLGHELSLFVVFLGIGYLLYGKVCPPKIKNFIGKKFKKRTF
jgi:hypothetical protein